MKMTCGLPEPFGNVEVGWRLPVFPVVLPPVADGGGGGAAPDFWALAAPVKDNATAAKMAAPRNRISASYSGVIILRADGWAEAVCAPKVAGEGWS